MELGGRLGCHQLPERSFFVRGFQLPVCARCTGALFGELAASVMAALGLELASLASAALLFVMGLDWFTQRIGVLESSNLRRFLTGICGGMGVTFMLLRLIAALALALLMGWVRAVGHAAC